MTVAELTEALSLHTIKKQDWHIQACSAVTGKQSLPKLSFPLFPRLL